MMNAVMLAMVVLSAGAPPEEPGEYIHVTDCAVTLIDDIQVPARESGVLTQLHAR